MLLELIIIQLITFTGLIIVLRLLFYRHLNAALVRLRSLHEENLSREEELKKEMENMQRQKEAELQKAKTDAEKIMQLAKEKASKLSADIYAQAKEQAARVLESANEQARHIEQDISNRVRDQAIGFAADIYKILFSRQNMDSLQRQFVAELIEELKDTPEEKFTVKDSRAKVTCALAINEEEKLAITHVLSQKLHNRIDLQEVTSPDIIAGLIIQIGALTIDGSLRSKLRKIAPYLKA